jgi:hypothetical protein
VLSDIPPAADQQTAYDSLLDAVRNWDVARIKELASGLPDSTAHPDPDRQGS